MRLDQRSRCPPLSLWGVGTIPEELGLNAKGTQREDPGSDEDGGEYRSGQTSPGGGDTRTASKGHAGIRRKGTVSNSREACGDDSVEEQVRLVTQVVRRLSRTSGSRHGLPKGMESQGRLRANKWYQPVL